MFADFERWGFDERGWAPRTRHKYALEVRAAERWLQAHGSSVLWATARELKSYLFSKPPNARTRNLVRQALVSFGCFMVDQRIAETNSALGLPRLPEPEPLPQALERAQARRVEIVAPSFGPMAEALVMVFLYGGLRKTEARLLERSFVIEDARWLQFCGKRRKDRAVPLKAPARRALKSWLAENPDPQWVFPSPRGNGRPVSDTLVRNLIWEVGNSAGIERLHPHAMRHTVATVMLENGATIREVQEMLGHADPKTTAIYTKVRPVRLREAVETQLHFGEEA